MNIQRNYVKVPLINRVIKSLPVLLMMSTALAIVAKPAQADYFQFSTTSNRPFNSISNFSDQVNTVGDISRTPNGSSNLLVQEQPVSGGNNLMGPRLNSPISNLNSTDASFSLAPINPNLAEMKASPSSAKVMVSDPKANPTSAQSNPVDTNENLAPMRSNSVDANSNLVPAKLSSADANPRPNSVNLSSADANSNSQILVIYTNCYPGMPTTEWVELFDLDHVFGEESPDIMHQSKNCRR
jgi:hypothetical protein